LHIAFLIQWILGDSLNAIGAILTGQLTTQILTGIYFVSMDVILIAQWIYYMMKNRIKSQNEETLEDGEESQAEYESKSLLRSVLWIVAS
jgi:low temperature requirement protein LtrA